MVLEKINNLRSKHFTHTVHRKIYLTSNVGIATAISAYMKSEDALENKPTFNLSITILPSAIALAPKNNCKMMMILKCILPNKSI